MTDELHRLRTAVALHRDDARTVVDLRGRDAIDAIDAIVSGELYVRDGRILHTFVLGDDGVPLADVHVALDDDGVVVLVDGMDGRGFLAHLAQHAGHLASVAATDRSSELRSIGIHGPYAWELCVELLGDDVLGLPYLSFCRFGATLCVRAGETGEYGYELLVPREREDDVLARIAMIAPRYDAGFVGRDTLDAAALENGFFRMRLGHLEGLTPFELQQQWRVSYRKDFVGKAEVERHRDARGPRLVHLRTYGAAAGGDPVSFDGTDVGRVVAALPSAALGCTVARALVPHAIAHPGLEGFVVGAGTRARSVSAPLVRNRSLYVDPRKHSYHQADERPSPPLDAEIAS